MKTKRVLSFILAFAMILTTIASMGIVSVSADETETTAKDDFMMYDFSSDSASASTWNYNNSSLGASGKLESTTDVTRHDSDYSMKWSTGANTARAQAINYYDTSKLTYEQATSYKYLNMWMYSDYGENASVPEKPESLYVLIESESKIIYTKKSDGTYVSARTDSNTGEDSACPIYNQGSIDLNWQGWKLVSIDISGMSCSWKGGYTDDSSGTLCTASDFQKVKVRFGNDGYGKQSEEKTWKPIDNNIVYVDSIWLSDTDPREIEQNDITLSVDNGATDIAVGTKNFVITANNEFALGKDNLEDALTITADGETVDKSAYTLQKEFNKLYVDFKNDLDENTKYTFTLDSTKWAFSDGTYLSADFSSSFTTEQLMKTIGDLTNGSTDGFNGVNAYKPNDTRSICAGIDYDVHRGGDGAFSALKWTVYPQKTEGTGDDEGKVSYGTNHLYSAADGRTTVQDLLDYDYLCFWIYNDTPVDELGLKNYTKDSSGWYTTTDLETGYINVMLSDTVTGGYRGSTNTADKYLLNIDWTGWKFVKVDISGLTKLSAFDKNSTTATATDVIKLHMNVGGWNLCATNELDFYLSNVFLAKEEYFAVDKDDILLGDFGTSDLCGWTRKISTNGPTTMELSTDVTRDDKTASMKWTGFDPNKNDNYLNSPDYTDMKTFEEVNAYDYINAWIYSEKATNQTFNILVNERGTTSEGTKRESNSYINMGNFTVDWSGWKLVSVKNAKSKAIKDETITTRVGIFFKINSGGWGTQESISADTTLCFDSIWLSKEAPSDATVAPECTIANNATISSATNAVGFEYAYDLVAGKDYSNLVTVKCGENDVAAADYKVQAEGNMLYVVFKNGLKPNKSYTIHVGGINVAYKVYSETSVSFETAAANYDLQYDFNMNSVPTDKDTTFTASAVLANATESETTGRIIMGIYDGDNNLVSAILGDDVTIGVGKTKRLEVQTSGDAAYAGCNAKAYVWQWDSLVPYTDAVGTIGK